MIPEKYSIHNSDFKYYNLSLLIIYKFIKIDTTIFLLTLSFFFLNIKVIFNRPKSSNFIMLIY